VELNQIFNRTLANPATQDKLEVEAKQRKPDRRQLPSRDYHRVSDSVLLSSGGGLAAEFTQQPADAESTVGLPSLSRGYASHLGGLLDIVA